MGKTSSAVKQKFNEKTYEQFNVRILPELDERIKNYCKKNNNLSRSQFLQKAINELDK